MNKSKVAHFLAHPVQTMTSTKNQTHRRLSEQNLP